VETVTGKTVTSLVVPGYTANFGTDEGGSARRVKEFVFDFMFTCVSHQPLQARCVNTMTLSCEVCREGSPYRRGWTGPMSIPQ
jgi:hypothetical protein